MKHRWRMISIQGREAAAPRTAGATTNYCAMFVWGAALGLAGLARAQGPAPQVLEAENQRVAAIAKASAAAVSVFGPGGRGGGSGVVITADGYALTNFHVVRPAGDFMKCSLPDGRLYDAVIVGVDPVGDVAMIKLLGREDFPTAELGDSDLVQAGDWCFAVGNPFLLATDFQPTVSYGIVSGVHRYQYPSGTLLEYADCIQTDAAINPGNSGGPLFNASGQLIGINGRGSFEKRGRVNVGVGYAISINQIKNFLGCLHSGRIVDHATLGANVTTDEQGRVVVSNILPGSDAYRRGLRYGDEIISFAGRELKTVNQFKNALGVFPRNWRLALAYRREGQRMEALVRLAGVHDPEALYSQVEPPAAPAPSDPKPPGEKPAQDKNALPKPPGDPPPAEPAPAEPAPAEPAPAEPAPEPDSPPAPKPSPPRPNRPADPQPTPGLESAQPPAEIAKLIEKRHGYANYYFNRLRRDQVWREFMKHEVPTGDWLVSGQLEEGGRVEFRLGAEQVEAKFPAVVAALDLRVDLADQLSPPGSGGLLTSLHVWQRLLQLGPERFGEVYYEGAAPLAGREGLFEVLVATHDVIEARFYFHPVLHQLAAVEMYSDSDRDPCELYFDDYQSDSIPWLPRRLTVRFGDATYAVLLLDNVAGPSDVSSQETP